MLLLHYFMLVHCICLSMQVIYETQHTTIENQIRNSFVYTKNEKTTKLKPNRKWPRERKTIQKLKANIYIRLSKT